MKSRIFLAFSCFLLACVATARVSLGSGFIGGGGGGGLGNVTLTGTPSGTQVPTATSSTTATWQTPTNSGWTYAAPLIAPTNPNTTIAMDIPSGRPGLKFECIGSSLYPSLEFQVGTPAGHVNIATDSENAYLYGDNNGFAFGNSTGDVLQIPNSGSDRSVHVMSDATHYVGIGAVAGITSSIPFKLAGTPTAAGYVLTDVQGNGTLSMRPSAAGGVTSITQTANQITASASTGAVTLSLPSTITLTGASQLGSSTGAFTLATGGGNGDINLTPNGTGLVRSTSIYGPLNSVLYVGTNEPFDFNFVTSGTTRWKVNSTGSLLSIGAQTFGTTSNGNLTLDAGSGVVSLASGLTVGAHTLALASATVSGQPTWSSSQTIPGLTSSTLTTTSGALTLSTGGGNGDVICSPNGTGVVRAIEVYSKAGNNFYCGTTDAHDLNFVANNLSVWRLNGTSGAFESVGANTLQSATGNLTVGTGAANGNLLLTPNGTGGVALLGATPVASQLAVTSETLTGTLTLTGATIAGSPTSTLGTTSTGALTPSSILGSPASTLGVTTASASGSSVALVATSTSTTRTSAAIGSLARSHKTVTSNTAFDASTSCWVSNSGSALAHTLPDGTSVTAGDLVVVVVNVGAGAVTLTGVLGQGIFNASSGTSLTLNTGDVYTLQFLNDLGYWKVMS